MAELQNIKQRFFALRNGILADQLRTAGAPYKTVFGLNIPQITEISQSLDPDPDLVQALWNDREVRESRILAICLMKGSRPSLEQALRLMDDVRTPEEADMLAFKLLKHLPEASALANSRPDPNLPLAPYVRRSLLRHIQ